MKAKIIYPNNTFVETNPKNSKFFTLEELQKIVGGYIEIIRPPSKNGAILVINEEGKLNNLPVNKLASEMWQENCSKGSERALDYVVGNVLLCHESQLEK